ARLLILKGDIKLAAEHIDHEAVRPAFVLPGITADYGRYVAATCIGCHGESLSGGPIAGAPPSWPLAANLTPHPGNGISTWSETDFVAALRTSKRPDGSAFDPVMPAAFGEMTEVEIRALWAYLRTI